MRYLTIPAYNLLGFGLRQLVEHVVDHSPAYGTRSQLRLGHKAIDAVAAAADGVAELEDDVAMMLQQAADVAPLPRLAVNRQDAEGKPVGQPEPIPARAFDPFYDAIANMTDKRPEPKAETLTPQDIQELRDIAAVSAARPLATAAE